jgi:hypothetical protein
MVALRRTETLVTARDLAVTKLRAPGVLVAALFGAAMLLGACGSAAPANASAAATQATCSQVSAVLSDGPDPQADPVGYAEAQIRPLSQIRTADPQLRAAITGLAGAYREYFASNGTSHGAATAVTAASKQVDAICPGATS